MDHDHQSHNTPQGTTTDTVQSAITGHFPLNQQKLLLIYFASDLKHVTQVDPLFGYKRTKGPVRQEQWTV